MVKSSVYSGKMHHSVNEMMLKIWIILAAAGFAVSAVHTTQMEVLHGNDLTLDIPYMSKELKFVAANEKKQITVWKRNSEVLKNQKLCVTPHVTFNHMGTFTLLSERNNEISRYTVKVKGRTRIMKRAPGGILDIPLDGIELKNATLFFDHNGLIVTLVNSGEPVRNKNPRYINRLIVSSKTINVLNVNLSDLGKYILKDDKHRIVSESTLKLVERHIPTSNKKALISLVLLLIPVTVGCYSMIKCCCKDDESNKANTNTLNAQPESVPMCQTVTDPSQCYPTPVQGQIQYPPSQQSSGQPAVPPYLDAPQNPVYPPGPVGPPAQPPQWNVPPNQYYPPAPVNYNPVMNNTLPGPYPTTA